MEYLGDKLKRLREDRGWTRYEACERTKGVMKWESLTRLEEGRTDPSRLLIKTAIALIDIYYPDLELTDLVGDRFGSYAVRRTQKGKKK